LYEKSVRGIARERGVHRRQVRQALESAVPPARRLPDRDPPVLTRALQGLIREWIDKDRWVHRKQRHTSRRVFHRIRNEHGYLGAESTVRRFVSRCRRELGLGGEAFVPLVHVPGEEAEVDWGEADVQFPWGLERAQFFHMRACSSGREFVMAFPRQTQQAFLEAHVAALEYFGGVFKVLRYDNLKSAVTKVLRGRRRVESDRFIALRSHYLFDSEFCRPGKEGAHEKGGVEGGIGRFRRTHLVPVPNAHSYDELNRRILDDCARDDMRRIEGRQATILEQWADERPALRALPPEPLSTYEVSSQKVNSKGCVKVRTNRYSVPIHLAGLSVEVRLHAQRVEMRREGKVVARHPRLHARHEIRVELDHYLPLLWNKPGALKRSLPLRQARERDEWPAAYDGLWAELRHRFDEPESVRQMLTVLMMHREAPPDEVLVAVELAMEHGCCDAGAISVLLRQLRDDERVAKPLQGLGALKCYDRPMSGLADYDQLLTQPKIVVVY
jgi:transposase